MKAACEEEEFIVNEIVTKNILSGSTYFHGTVTLKTDTENAEDIKNDCGRSIRFIWCGLYYLYKD